MIKKIVVSLSAWVLISGTLLPVAVVAAETIVPTNETDVSDEKNSSVTEDSALSSTETSDTDSSVEDPVSKEGSENLSKEEAVTEDVQKSGENKTNPNVLNQTDGIVTTVTAPAAFKTYTDPVTGVKPDDLAVAVAVSIGQPDIEGATIEIPYGFIPDTANPVYKDFTMTEPIFSLVMPEAPSGDSIVESYEESPSKDKLLIHLKKTTTTVETLNLKFTYNPEYDAKIPVNQVIWEDLEAITWNTEGEIISKSLVSQVKSDTRDGMGAILTYFNPTNSVYTGGTITTRAQLNNSYNHYSLMNETNPDDNRAYLEVPEGSNILGVYRTFYGTTVTTSDQDSSIPVGYVRYYRNITDNAVTFTTWNYRGNINDNSRNMDGGVIPPNDMTNDTEFHIKTGMIYRKWNAGTKDVFAKRDYKKQDLPDWSIHTPNTHSTGGGSLPIVSMGNTNNSTTVSVGSYWLPHSGSMINNGKRDITNMTLSLNQPSTGAGRINYGLIQVTSNVSSGYEQGFVKIELVIKNALTGSVRTVSGGQGKDVLVSLPALESNEFIENVLAIPMGIDGETEGALPPGNGLRIQYRAANWPSGSWPDGSDIPIDRVSTVMMGWTLTYDNEKDGIDPTPITVNGVNYPVYYAPSQTTRARAQIVSSQASARAPGDIVEYRIQGYNEINAVGQWVNPEIGIAVPKVLELQDPNEYKEFIDAVNKTTHKDAVKVTLVSSDDTNNYYKFNASATGYKNDGYVSFEIPVSFKVAGGTLPGSYPIPFVTASHNVPTFVQLSGAINNLNASTASKLGYTNTYGDTYSAFTTGNTGLTIASSSKLNGFTAGRKQSSDAWSNLTNFAVENGGKPQMQASIVNEGNTSFESIRLYDILPSKEDGRGSTGDISFTTVDSVGASTVYYTTKAITELPKYDTNLQEWTSTTLASHGFTTTKPENESEITAIYIDFGATVVSPNASLDTILNFKVPEEGTQTAINQFQYSAKEKKTAITLNAQSQQVTFSTEVAQISYHENLPALLPTGVTGATNIPGAQSELIQLDGTSSIKLSDTEPTLPGYTFDHWVYHSDSKKTYKPGDTINFTKDSSSTTIQLDAVWKANKIVVTYNENYGTTPKTTDVSYNFGANVDTDKVKVSERKGYEFIGWSLSQNATTADFTNDTKIDFVNNQTVYGVWKAIDYTISFENNGGEGTMAFLNVSYDVESVLPTNTFVRDGYLFQGWATSPKDTVEYADGATVKNLTDKKDHTIKLYAVWKKDETSIVAKDSTLYVGDTWAPKDNFISATDKDGVAVGYDKIVGPETTAVDTNKVGSYPVTYSYGGKTTTVTVDVLANQESLEVKDVTIYAGDEWTAKDNFVSATQKDGKEVAFKDITVTDADKVDTAKEGEYLVTYSYGSQTKVGKVIVLKNQTSIKAKDSTIYVGDTWNPKDNFVSATAKDGSEVDYDQVTGPKTTAVDTKKVGTYPVTYSYGGQTTTVNIKVVANQETLVVKDVTIYAGDEWTAQDNFVSATQKDGKEVAFKYITVTDADKVDTAKVGEYLVTYSYGDQKEVGKVIVLKNQTSIKAKDSTIYVGDTWEPEDNFVSATAKDGSDVTYANITGPEASAVDTNTIGSYPVTYSYGGKTTTVTVNVLANQESLEVKDVTIYAGDEWTAKDNFVSATQKDGKEVAFKDITVTDVDKVDTAKEGKYLVTYSYGAQTKVGKVIVLKNQTSIKAKDSTIYVGDTWKPEDNFVSATAKDGSDVAYAQVAGPKATEVDTTKVGSYPVTYSYEGKTDTVTVKVVEDLSSITVKDSTIKIGTKWVPGDNFVSATDRSGKPLNLEDLSVLGTVNTEKAGVYTITYRLSLKGKTRLLDDEKEGDILEAVAKVTVVDEKTPLDNPTKKGNGSKLPGNTTTVKASDKYLPKTGEEYSAYYGYLGLSMLAIVSIGFGIRRRKQKQ